MSFSTQYAWCIVITLHSGEMRWLFDTLTIALHLHMPREVRRIGGWGGAGEARINSQLKNFANGGFSRYSFFKKYHSNVTSRSRHQPPAFVSSGVAHFGSITATAAAGVGFSRSMMRSVQLLCRSRVWSTWPQVHTHMQLKICTVFVILKEFATSTPLET